MPDKDYTVTEFADRGPAQFGSTRYSVQFEEDNSPNISLFSKYPVKQGDKLFGHIETVEKNGAQYKNFKFGKKENKPSQSQSPESIARLTNLIEFKVLPVLQTLLERTPKKGIDYPLDEINPEDTPF